LFDSAARNLIQYKTASSLSFITRKELEVEFGFVEIIKKVFPEAKVVILPSMTQGAAQTAFAGIQQLKVLSGPIVIADCDQWVSGDGLMQMLNSLEEESADICLPTFISDSKSYSYLDYGADSSIQNIVEKEVVSCNAVSGCYAFRDVNLFVHLYSSITEWGREQYMSQVVSQGIKMGHKVLDFKLTNHVPYGTPEEMNAALKNVQFLEWLKKI